MKTSSKGINLIKEFEGLELEAYLCPANVWTIGYGHTKTVTKGMVISEEGAEELLKQDLRHYENGINKHVKVELNQNQFDALVSFSYNLGVFALRTSTLLRVLNEGDYEEAANQFGRWVRANGKVLNGLVRRREAERSLFLRPHSLD